MNLADIDLNYADLHIHTIASDGEMTADEILTHAARIGLKTVSITDHDGVGAYTGRVRELTDTALSKGLELITGTELDSEYKGIEVHILGYGIDVENGTLTRHLSRIQRQRKKRILEILEKVNLNLKNSSIKENEVIVPGRETLMKPHIVRLLQGKGLFDSYPEASRWVSKNCRAETVVRKLPPDVIIGIILDAGGIPVLAHPAYYAGINGIALPGMISELMEMGLAGIEVYYDYFGLDPGSLGYGSYGRMISDIERIAREQSLFVTRGSDSHTLDELTERNPPDLSK